MVKRRRSRKLKIGLIIFLLLILSGVTYLIVKMILDGQKPSSEETNELITAVVEEKKSDNTAEPIFVEEGEGKKVVQFDGEDPNDLEELTGAITFASVDPDGKKLMVRVNIDQFLEEGLCTAYIYNSDDEALYSSEAGIVGSASTSTCEGFDVPVANLESGKMQIVINLSSGDKVGKIIGEVKI